jgi:hypothetical protein
MRSLIGWLLIFFGLVCCVLRSNLLVSFWEHTALIHTVLFVAPWTGLAGGASLDSLNVVRWSIRLQRPYELKRNDLLVVSKFM